MRDDRFDALADRQRRRILAELLEHNPRDASVVTTAERDAKRRQVMNHHVHLPKLDDYGFIKWDRSEEVVTRGPRFEEIQPFLELIDGRQGE
ncbi:DUF7344 domain-containing protein [Natrialbaceae archaeon A-gly3]